MTFRRTIPAVLLLTACAWPAMAAPKDAPAAKAVPPAAAPGAAAPEAAAKPVVLPETVATVEGTEIKKEELLAALHTMMSSRGMTIESIPVEKQSEAYHMLLDEMIVDKLLNKRSAAVKVSDEDFNGALARVKQNFGSDEEMKTQLEKSGQSVEKLKEDIRSSLQQQQWLDAQVKTTPVTEADASKFYQENPKQFEKPERVRASHILVKVELDAKPEEIAAKEKQAQAILARVKAGEDFAKLATELSEDPSAKENGGDLNFFAKEQMVPEFSNAAFAMKKGDISEPVRSKFGYHIIKVTDHTAPATVTLDEVKPQLIAYLERQKKQEEIGKVIQDVRAKADVKVNLP